MGFVLDDAETAALQRHMLTLGADLGHYGPKGDGVDGDGGATTRSEFHRLFAEHFPEPVSDREAGEAPAFPHDRESEMRAFFGEPGLHQVRLALPFPMRIAWDLDKTISGFSCHEKVHDSLKRIFERTLKEYGLDRIRALGLDRFGGCLNVRKKRGGSTWSTHAWGAAVDLWPEANALRWDKTRAAFAGPAYRPFWEIVESEGWTSLGRARDFDWMHFQAPRI